jgi:plasmid stabilization system protein ParE
MSSIVRISPRARDDIREARDWYEAQSSGLGEELGLELDALFGRIVDQPLMFPTVHRNVRRGLVRRFPYAIYFVLEDDRVRFSAFYIKPEIRNRGGADAPIMLAELEWAATFR